MENSKSKIQKAKVSPGKKRTIGLLSFLLFLLVSNAGFGQIGGSGTYQFLDLTNSAKMAALGGTQIALSDNDVALTFYNPSLLTDSMRSQLSVNYVSYIAGIGVGYAAYAPNIKGKNRFAAAIHFVNYGTFEGASETGQLTGTFKAAEYAVNLFYSRKITTQIRAGLNLKPIISSLESYHSFGLAADLGITYSAKDGHSAISFVTRNIGHQITTYYQNGVYEKLPWDMQLGFSRLLNTAPIKFLVTADHLNRWNLAYIDLPSNLNTVKVSTENFSSLLMRHLILGAEIVPEQHVTLRFGYNYQRRKDLAVDGRPGLVGYSAGVGVKITKFNISYAIASFHPGAAAHYFSLTTTLSELLP